MQNTRIISEHDIPHFIRLYESELARLDKFGNKHAFAYNLALRL